MCRDLKFGNHFVIFTVKTALGENHQWILNLGGDFQKGEVMCMILKYLISAQTAVRYKRHTGTAEQHQSVSLYPRGTHPLAFRPSSVSNCEHLHTLLLLCFVFLMALRLFGQGDFIFRTQYHQ